MSNGPSLPPRGTIITFHGFHSGSSKTYYQMKRKLSSIKNFKKLSPPTLQPNEFSAVNKNSPTLPNKSNIIPTMPIDPCRPTSSLIQKITDRMVDPVNIENLQKKRKRKKKKNKIDEETCYPPIPVPSRVCDSASVIEPSLLVFQHVHKKRRELTLSESLSGSVTRDIFQNKDYRSNLDTHNAHREIRKSVTYEISEDSKERVLFTPQCKLSPEKVLQPISNDVAIDSQIASCSHRIINLIEYVVQETSTTNSETSKKSNDTSADIELIQPEIITLSSESSEKYDDSQSKSHNDSPSLLESFVTAIEPSASNLSCQKHSSSYKTSSSVRPLCSQDCTSSNSEAFKSNESICDMHSELTEHDFSHFKPSVTSSQLSSSNLKEPDQKSSNTILLSSGETTDKEISQDLNNAFIEASSGSSSNSDSLEMLNKSSIKCLKSIVLILSNHFNVPINECLKILRNNTFNITTTLQELQILESSHDQRFCTNCS